MLNGRLKKVLFSQMILEDSYFKNFTVQKVENLPDLANWLSKIQDALNSKSLLINGVSYDDKFSGLHKFNKIHGIEYLFLDLNTKVVTRIEKS